MNNLTIRLETEKDYSAVEELTREAFWNIYKPGADEHYFVHTMRSHPDFIPELAFVLELDGRKWMYIPSTALGTLPCLMCKSLEQMLASVTLTIASLLCCNVGLGFSTKPNFPFDTYV